MGQKPLVTKAGKRKPKNEIKFLLTLAPDQKEGKAVILNSKITLIKGKAGSGKTGLGVQIGLDELFKGNVKKIFITRPTVSKEENGYLPGGLDEKMAPWMIPIMDNMYSFYNKEKIDKEVSELRIEIAPMQFMRGRTFTDSFIIVDEAQNINREQIEMILTRVGMGSRMVICGDLRQNDLKKFQKSGLRLVELIQPNVEGLSIVELTTNHRDPIVESILNEIQKFDNIE